MITVRPYKKEDKEKVNSVAVDAFLQFKDHYNDWDSIESSVGTMASLASTSDIIVAEINNVLVGAAALVHPGEDKNNNLDTPWSFIRMLVVSPQHRSKGIGKKLAMECVGLARAHGLKTIGLYTSPIMKVAPPMYLRMGFEKVKGIEPICGVEYALYKLDIKL